MGTARGGRHTSLCLAQINPDKMENPEAMGMRRPFDPTAHELDGSFRLTKFADLKG